MGSTIGAVWVAWKTIYVLEKEKIFKVKKRKKNQDVESYSDLNINIPGFVENISSRKLTTFITAGPHLHQLLEALNNNWVLLDIIDDISITWLENIRKDEWEAFIKNIKGY